jgi:hypothetical protein
LIKKSGRLIALDNQFTTIWAALLRVPVVLACSQMSLSLQARATTMQSARLVVTALPSMLSLALRYVSTSPSRNYP